MKYLKYVILLFTISYGQLLSGQYRIEGKVKADGKLSEKATLILDQIQVFVETDLEGTFLFTNVKKGSYTLTVFLSGFQTQNVAITVPTSSSIEVNMVELETQLEEVTIKAEKDNVFGISRLKAIDGAGIYEAKKTEVILLEDVVANKAANNTRQVFAKIPGANIWESDCAGLQIGVATRGLSPNRNANFNTRQNGYDISADALGYPESYYTPPIQALEKIELVRGAASLQYGTQFGGLVNFVIKKPPTDKVVEVSTEQTYNSLGFYNSYVDAGGSAGKMSYFFFNRTVAGDCWRCNTDFNSMTSYLDIHYEFSDAFKVGVEYTRMNYLSKQPGGLTDLEFAQDAKQSNRERNWFDVDWNLIAAHLEYTFSPNLRVDSKFVTLLASKKALGNLGRIDRIDDPTQERDLLADEFRNFTNETRLIYTYNLGHEQSAFLIGARFYHGFTHRRQGLGPAGDKPTFRYNNPDRLEDSDFDLPGKNYSAFIENIFTITPRFSITPGLRYEYIKTEARGYYNPTSAGNGLKDTLVFESNERTRDFLFGGVGLSFKMNPNVEFYGNFSQNYRSINFNDIRVNNPSLIVDPNINDEFGSNVDAGARGNIREVLNYDVSLFLLQYNDRIGTRLVVGQDPRYDFPIERTFRLRTNIADARMYGLEAFVEANVFRMFSVFASRNDNLSLFMNLGVIESEYTRSNERVINGNKVELVPQLNVKTGVTYQGSRLSASVLWSGLSEQYSDATNAEGPVAGAIEGVIPAYSVMDLAVKYRVGKGFNVQAGINNLLDARYFTRRAAGYPGPGIMPSDGRSFNVTLGYYFGKDK